MKGNSKKYGLDNPAFERGPTDLRNGNDTKVGTEEQHVEPEERAQWGNDIEFLMSCIAMSVGLGNIWRFPFIANRNGGGAFLIPYIIILTFIGRPMYYMEMALGQFSSRGSIKMYEKLSPVFKGIGFGQVLGCTCVASYYSILMAITLFYLIHSFTSDFSWATCQADWEQYTQSRNITCIDKFSNVSSLTGSGTISSSELFFRREVLKEKDDISDGMGPPEWRLTLLLLFSWVVTFLVSVRGVKSSGKASYFLALFPYVIMITLLIRAATLEGAADGMLYFIETDFERLLDAEVFPHIFVRDDEYMPHFLLHRDALVVSTLDTFTSLLSGITIFGILGNLAFEMKVSPSEVISAGGGAGIAFISYPDAISKFGAVPWLFAILFFFMLFVLGIGSLVALHGTLNTSIKDAFPAAPNWMISSSTAVILFLVGLIYTTPGGQYTLDLVDHFGGTFVIFVCAILEVFVVTWLYGIDNFCMDLEFITKKKVGIYWRISWGIITPILLLIIFVYFLVTLQPLTYGIYNLYYPIGLSVLGWGILAACVLLILWWMIYALDSNREYPAKQMILKTFSTENWSPNGQKLTEEWKNFKENRIDERGPRKGGWISQKMKILVGK